MTTVENRRIQVRLAGRRYRERNLEVCRERERKQARNQWIKNGQFKKWATPKNVARNLLRKAVESGKIEKPCKCEECKLLFPLQKIHGHHHDYAKPFDVRWLCRKCHGLEHRKIRALPIPSAGGGKA
jgi:hypothetical protein